MKRVILCVESEVWPTMKKTYFDTWKRAIEKLLYVVSVILACYGFWGSLFPDLTWVEGTYRIVEEAAEEGIPNDYRAEELYADILEGKYRVTYSSKIWETIKNIYGHRNDE